MSTSYPPYLPTLHSYDCAAILWPYQHSGNQIVLRFCDLSEFGGERNEASKNINRNSAITDFRNVGSRPNWCQNQWNKEGFTSRFRHWSPSLFVRICFFAGDSAAEYFGELFQSNLRDRNSVPVPFRCISWFKELCRNWARCPYLVLLFVVHVFVWYYRLVEDHILMFFLFVRLQICCVY